MRSLEAIRSPAVRMSRDAKSPLGHGLTAGIGSEGRKPWLWGSLHSLELERDGGAEGFPVGCRPGQRMP